MPLRGVFEVKPGSYFRPVLESENLSRKRVRTMTLLNPLKSLTWKTSSRRSSRRVRRCVPGFTTDGHFAAEILEQRALLSANVTATVASVGGVGSLTLTSDSGDDSVNVYRLDANDIEVDGLNGTTINNNPSATFALSTVTGITVNLGSGYDQYSIFSQSGDPALNVGKGGIVFVGAGGVEQDTLEVSNQSSNPMTILGSVTVGGSTAGSPLDLVGSGLSEFEVHADSSGSLTIDGSVSFIESGTYIEANDIYTDGTGDLTIGRGVTENVGTGDSMQTQNLIYTAGAGNIKIGGSVTQTAAATNESQNLIVTEAGSPGSIAIGGSVTETSTGSPTDYDGLQTSAPAASRSARESRSTTRVRRLSAITISPTTPPGASQSAKT